MQLFNLRAMRRAGAVWPGLPLVILASAMPVMAISTPVAPREMNDSLRNQIIDSVSDAINEAYVFPDVAEAVGKHLRRQNQAGAFDQAVSLSELAEALTEEIYSICGDRHLQVRFRPDEFFESDTDLTEEQIQEIYNDDAWDNFAFEDVERLPGNVGYLRIHGFHETDWAGPTAIAAMNFIGHCDAVIIDLRESLGGQPSMVQLLASYFFDNPVHLNSFYIREGNTERQFWTHAYVPGPRLSDAKLYILTSGQTVSAAEELAYDLKHLDRAVIVGEKTRGAAHPARNYSLPSLNLSLSIPYGRAINPVTGTNWEGVGVEPDIRVESPKAFHVAYLDALESLKRECLNEDRLIALDWAIDGAKAGMNEITVSAQEMQDIAGRYNGMEIVMIDNRLTYRSRSGASYVLFPMGDDLYGLEGLKFLRLKFVRDESGAVTLLKRLFYDGRSDESPKSR